MDAREKTKENHSQGHRGCMQRSAKRDCGNSERGELGATLDLRQVKSLGGQWFRRDANRGWGFDTPAIHQKNT